jgi:hypothetical protein
MREAYSSAKRVVVSTQIGCGCEEKGVAEFDGFQAMVLKARLC